MQMVLWAFGSMLAFLLILSFLPIGFTFKGKAITAFAGLVLALVGLLASTVLSILQTVFILFLLVLSTAMILNRRLESVLYKSSLVPEFMDEIEEDFTVYKPVREISSKEPFASIPVMEVPAITMDGPELAPQKPEIEHLEIMEEVNLFPLLEMESPAIDQKKFIADSFSDEGYLSEIESLLEENQSEELLVIK